MAGEVLVEQNINREPIPGPIQLLVVASDSDVDVQQRNMDVANITILSTITSGRVKRSTDLGNGSVKIKTNTADAKWKYFVDVHTHVCVLCGYSSG